eukprot:gene12591-1747_t
MTQRHLQAACEAWTTTEYKGGSYLGISPRVFFEEVLPASFIEIKCMVFHGTTHYLYVAQALLGLKIDETLHGKIGPSLFVKVLKTCDAAGEGFDHHRVDVYTDLTTKEIMLGEVTAYPFGGVTNWSPKWFAHHLANDLWGCRGG